VRSERSIDVGSPPELVFAVLSDPARIGDWSTLFTAGDGTRRLDDGGHVALRWRWHGSDEIVDATVEFGQHPFVVRYEGKADDGTRFELRECIAPAATGARVDVVVDLEPPPGALNGHNLQRALDRDVENMSARIYALLERSRAQPTSGRRGDLLPRRPRVEPTVIQSTAAVHGHPLHPMLVPFPIAFLVATLVADGLFTATDSLFLAQTARWLSIAGVVTGVLAAFAGATDFFTKRAIRAIGWAWVHAIGNLIAVALSACNFALRVDDPAAAVHPWGLVLSAVVVSIVAVTWWLGGELAYRHHVGVIGPVSDHPLDAPGVEAGRR